MDGGRPDRVVPDTGFGEVCEVASAVAEPLPATLMFQVDTSGSMNCPANDRGCVVADPTPAPDDSRWDVFRIRLLEALDALPDATRVGFMRYPRPGGGCPSTTPEVAIEALTSARAAFAEVLAGLAPSGTTPTHDAVMNAFGVLRADGGERRSTILATDGAATVCLGCDGWCELGPDNERMIRNIEAAASEGIATYVIGVPGSQSFRSVLSRMALAGGTAPGGCSSSGPSYCHYDLTDPAIDLASGLRDALASIGESAIRCEYEIPDNPEGTFDETRVNVVLTGDDGTRESLRRDRARRDGWDYGDDGRRIFLHGPACERARALRSGRVDVQFGCPTLVF